MTSAQPDIGRRRGSGRKGDSREQGILDAAELILRQEGFEAMSVESVARGAGISRGSLYFYFGSKQEVLTALVARTMVAIDQSTLSASVDTSSAPVDVVMEGIAVTGSLWREHGTVMQAAIEVGQTIPTIKRLWGETLEASVQGYSSAFVRAGVAEGPGPHEALALSRALCYMVERSFYWSFATSGADHLDEVTKTCQRVWLATLHSLERDS